MDFDFLTIFCSLAIFANKRQVAPKLSLTNVAALNYLLRSEIFVSKDRQLQAVHLILDFEPILEIYQEIGHDIRASDPWLARIDVSHPNFLAQEDLPPVIVPLQQVLPKVAATPREEIASSCSSLEEEINKFHFEENETQGVIVVHISDAKDELDRHLGVHASILMVSHPDSTSEKKEDEMALNRGNKGLRKLMATRNKWSTSKEAPKSQVPPILPPPPPLPPTDLGLHAIPNLKEKRLVQELEEWEVAPQKGTKQQKRPKTLRTRGPLLWTAEKSKI